MGMILDDISDELVEFADGEDFGIKETEKKLAQKWTSLCIVYDIETDTFSYDYMIDRIWKRYSENPTATINDYEEFYNMMSRKLV